MIYNVAFGVAKEYVMKSTSWQTLSIIRNFTVTVNSAVNFMLYCAFGQKFRKVFLKVFCARWLNSATFDKYFGVSTNSSMSAHTQLRGKKDKRKKWGNGSDYSRTSYTLVDGQPDSISKHEILNGDTAL